MNKFAMAAAAAVAVSSVWAIPGTVKTETDSKRGDIKWQPSSKSYLVSYKKGGTMVSAQYPLADVIRLDVDKPENLDKAIDMVRRGQATGAINMLAAIVRDYKMLQWDKLAGRYLVEAYLVANNVQKAYDTAQAIIAEDKRAAWMGDLAPAYWQALLKLGKNTQLENCLVKASTNGDRPAAAAATLMRGDIALTQEGDTPEGHRKALTDGYLRVALLFSDEPCRDVRQEAMMKAANSFDKLGMAARAEEMRTQAKAL